MNATPEVEGQKRLRRFQFTIRHLLIATALLACVLGIMRWRYLQRHAWSGGPIQIDVALSDGLPLVDCESAFAALQKWLPEKGFKPTSKPEGQNEIHVGTRLAPSYWYVKNAGSDDEVYVRVSHIPGTSSDSCLFAEVVVYCHVWPFKSRHEAGDQIAATVNELSRWVKEFKLKFPPTMRAR